VERAVKFVLSQQEPDGSWFGRWGVNYIYGTFLVLRGLEAIGIDRGDPRIQRAAAVDPRGAEFRRRLGRDLRHL
jgi:squalene-hopene/tetraprenyl-beta-curcumene cyclase